MAPSLISERSFTDRSRIYAVRLEIIGWAVLIIAMIVWLSRDAIPKRFATKVTASAALTALHGGTEGLLRQAFSAAQRGNTVEANLIAEPNPAMHGVFYLIVTADTSIQAKSGLTMMTNAIKTAIPVDAREDFKVSPNKDTYPAPNKTTQRLSIAFRLAGVILIVTAQVLIVLGALRQNGTFRPGLLVRLMMPFVIILLGGGGDSSGPAGIVHTGKYYIPPGMISFMQVLLPMTIIPLLLILWLTRKSKDSRGARKISGSPR